MKKTIFLTGIAGILILALGGNIAKAGTLENLERERSMILSNLISAELTPREREVKLETAKVRLVDLERMVMRDPLIKGKNTPDVQRAFNNYDMTFLMHASVEKNRTVVDHWLEQMGISTSSLMSAHVGRR